MKYPKFTLLFLLIFVLQLTAEFYKSTNLLVITKALGPAALALWLIANTKLQGRFHKRIFAGLLFALAGSIFSEYTLIAILICHLCYTSAFYLDFRSAPELDKKGAKIAIVLVFLFCLSFYFYMRPHFGIMKLPLLAAVIIVSLMMMMAAFRNQRVNKTSFQLILMGSILFLLSDVVFSVVNYHYTFNHATMLITSIFMAAQYLITLGGIERQLLNKA